MLAPRASNAFVCTRCELQLARRRLPAHFSRPSRARFSASVRLRDGAEELEAQLGTPPAGIKITKEIQQLDRVKKRKGKLMRETSAKLEGIKTLGDDADILVLKEIGKKETQEPAIEALPAEAVDVPDILASLQEERSALTPEEVHDRLESLRPKIDAAPNEPLYVSLKVFVKLIRTLSDGFTQQQLSQFYATAKNIRQTAYREDVLASLRASAEDAKRPFTRTEWQPETTPLAHRLPGALGPVKARNRTRLVSKQLLIDRIIRDLWKLVPLEEVEALGEIEISLKSWQVAMLTAGENESILDKVSSARKTKLEIHRQDSALRITADKTTAEYVANDIERALQNPPAQKLQLKPWIGSLEPGKVPENKQLIALYSNEDLRMITSATRVVVQRMENRNSLLLHGFDEGATAEAERALLRLLPLKETVIRTMDTQGLNDHARLLSTPFDAKSVDYKHREATLGRWLLPVTRQARTEGLKEDIESSEDLDFAKTSATRQVRVAAALEQYRKSATEDLTLTGKFGHWKNRPQSSLSATFGQALFPLDETVPSITDGFSMSASPQPIFTPSVPGMTTLFSSAQAQKPSASGALHFDQLPHKPVLVYDFIPAPQQQRISAGQLLPGLRIEMRTGAKDTEAMFHKMYIYLHEHLHTVLIPEGAADLQLQRMFRVVVREAHGIKALEEWVSAAKANIASGERISAPDLTIEIPKWTITGQPANATYMQTAKYLFSGVRFRHSVAGSFQGTAVSYKTNQSSKMSPQGGSLSMHCENPAQNVQAPAEGVDRVAQFLDQCFMFAERITQAASNTQPITKLERPKIFERSKKTRRQDDLTAQKDGEIAGVGPDVTNSALATADDLVVEPSHGNESTATANNAEAPVEQHQEEVALTDEVPALETQTIENKVEETRTSSAKDTAAVELSEDVPSPNDDSKTSKAQT